MDDIARQLPDPPPPRPAARAATIAAALATFDGAEAPAKVAAPRAVRWSISRGPAAAFASVALVAMIGIPLVLLKPNDRVAGPLKPVNLDAPTVNRPTAPAPPAPQELAAADAQVEPVARSPARPTAIVADTANVVTEVSPPPPAPAPVMAEPAPPPPPAPVPPPPMGFAAAPQAKAAPAALAARNATADRAREEIVVTGARISRDTGRGDWNACTVDDPARSRRGCNAALSDGLTRAWQGDWSAAITAFDAAIAAEPKLGAAYLNRGLAYWRAGEIARATADLDLAVRYAPSARSYYNRARVRRATGNLRGARSDEARALESDPDYAAVIDD